MHTVRLFIDPASIATGWALFKGKNLLKSGTIVVEGEISRRLIALHWRYRHLFQGKTLVDLKECHIEQFGGRPHRYLVFSVGVLLAAVDYAEEAKQDVPVSSWQKYVGWPKYSKQEKKDFEKDWNKYLDMDRCHKLILKQGFTVKSTDELAAIGMGLWYTEVKLSEKT